jgi:hypothetical protein
LNAIVEYWIVGIDRMNNRIQEMHEQDTGSAHYSAEQAGQQQSTFPSIKQEPTRPADRTDSQRAEEK